MRIWDVVVVGAGPSGALTAHQLARRGTSVLLLDRSAFPRWKVCGACLSAGSSRVLEAAGLGDVLAGLEGVGLSCLVLHASRRKAAVSLGGSLALSRSALDAALVRAAEAEGAVFWPEARAHLNGVPAGARRLRVVRGGTEVEIGARVVVDATGLGHGLRGGVARSDHVAAGSRVGLGVVIEGGGYPIASGDLHMAVGRAGYVGLVRVEDGSLNVAAALDPDRLRGAPPHEVVSGVLTEAGLPPVRETPLEGWRGTPLLTRASADVGRTRLLRIGDASGYVEPFTGEGICWALSAALAASPLVAAGAERWSAELLAAWRAYRTRAVGRSQRLCRVMAGALRRPRLVRTAVEALDLAPGLAAPFVSLASRSPPTVVPRPSRSERMLWRSREAQASTVARTVRRAGPPRPEIST